MEALIMIKRIVIVTAVLGSLLVSHSSQAHETAAKQPKSLTSAILLGLDPIPGDSLLYAGRPVQGTVDLIVGGVGLGLLLWGVTDIDGGHGLSCYDDCGIWYVLAGGLIYAPAYLWDLIGGPIAVARHNNEIAKQAKKPSVSWMPIAQVSDKGAFLGAHVRF